MIPCSLSIPSVKEEKEEKDQFKHHSLPLDCLDSLSVLKNKIKNRKISVCGNCHFFLSFYFDGVKYLFYGYFSSERE